jgi:Lon protease-like protein
MATERLTASDLAALPIFPLPQGALFPGTLLPLHVFEPRYRALTRDALAGRKRLALARLKPGFERDYGGRPPVFDICGAGEIVDHVAYPDGRYDIVLRGLSRVRILQELPPSRPYREVEAELMPDACADPALGAALETKLASLWHALSAHLPDAVRDLRVVTADAPDLSAFADRIAATLADPEITLHVLREPDPCDRLQALVTHLQALCDTLPRTAAATELN